ncbi:hypothetical protein BBJ28_00007665 [Nothophytophthora sp. Chile5]|nr:hypothetical protein BBJ28_00007665 [Nothophytophthora sp. Chile5]
MAVRESSEGVSGRLSLDLARRSYAPGEVLSGSVSLSALEQIQAREPLTVVVQGREAVGWDDGGDCPATNAFDKTFLKHKIVLTPDSTSYSAGDSLYPFSFQLPVGLASTFALENVYSGSMERLRVQVTYEVSVWLTVDSESVAYLQATQEFTVHAPPTITPPARALEVSTSETVHWLCCLDRGSLQLVVETPRDALVAGEAVSLTCRVNNSACKAPVSCLSVDLVEEIALRNVGERPELVATRVLSSQQVAGPAAGQILEQTVEVKVVEGEKQRPERFAHPTGEICGWRKTRTADRSFFSFAMHKTFYRASAQHLMTVMWQIMSNPARWEKLYSPVINIRIRLVQRVDKDNLVFFHDYCAMDADNDLTVLHCMYLVSKLPTANGGYLVLMRGLDRGRLVMEDLAKRDPAPAEGVGETLELWTNNFCWYAVGPGGRDTQATLSGMTPSLCTNAYFWISEIVQLVLRCEKELVGPVFTLPQ